MKWLFLLSCILMVLPVAAQEKISAQKKILPSLAAIRLSQANDRQQNFLIIVNDATRFRELLIEKKLSNFVIAEFLPSSLFVIRSSLSFVDSVFIPSPLVRFVDIVRMPVEETIIDGFDLGTNKINLAHDRFKSFNGDGTVVSVKENKPDSNDIDLKGRFINTPFASPVVTSHATIMSTIIGGGGNSFHTGRGAAWGATISSSNFANLIPENDNDYRQFNISVQNHSYGTGIENYYGADAAAYDASTISNPWLLHVFSAGNSGDKSGAVGPYAGVPGFANLTGSFKMAKNIITVGASDSLDNIPLLSSKGPAYDGRIRPEIIAFGQDGSSGAAALVSGTALLLQQAYKQANSGQLPSSALIKSVLLNSADDIGRKEIDYASGFGSLNAYAAIQTIVDRRYFAGSVNQGQLQTYSVALPVNSNRLKITLCWNDLPANPNAGKSLINDIDIRVVHTNSGNSWLPWVLNSAPSEDSLRQLPVRIKDSINNVEQITLDKPDVGNYRLEVTGYHIESGPQPYYISYQWDTLDQFRWEYPVKSDPVYGNRNNILRWKSTFTASAGKLYYSSDAGNTWLLISDNVDLDRPYYQWTAPSASNTIIFRMLVSGRDFLSDTSAISSRPVTGVGFNCADSFSLHWNSAPNTTSYTVYHLSNNYLEPLQTTADTSIVLKKATNGATHFAVAGNIGGKAGIKSYAFNYNTQGIGCYVKSFIVDLENSNTGKVLLELGTIYDVKELIIEKSTKNGFSPLLIIKDATSLQYSYADNSLVQGENTYRAKINLKSGQSIYTQVETIYYLPGINYLVYPNPAQTYFQLVSKDADNAELVVYTSTGHKMFSKKITQPVQRFSVTQLKRGLYFIVILQKNKKVYQGTIVIR